MVAPSGALCSVGAQGRGNMVQGPREGADCALVEKQKHRIT